MRVTTLALAALLCTVALPGLSQAGMVVVGSANDIYYAGAFTTPGQVLQITATGAIKMAEGFGLGPYDTNPDGTILDVQAPTTDWGVYQYMVTQHLTEPVVDGIVNISPVYHMDEIGQITGSPFGGLMAGFSSTLTPTSLSDFVNGFSFIGSSGSITAPNGSPYLFLSINDTNREDNVGSYDVTISEVSSTPEPASMALLGLTGLGGIGLRWRQQRKARSKLA